MVRHSNENLYDFFFPLFLFFIFPFFFLSSLRYRFTLHLSLSLSAPRRKTKQICCTDSNFRESRDADIDTTRRGRGLVDNPGRVNNEVETSRHHSSGGKFVFRSTILDHPSVTLSSLGPSTWLPVPRSEDRPSISKSKPFLPTL